MTDRRTYIRVHDGLPDHPKIIGLSDGAFRALIDLWCWAGQYGTDGRISAEKFSKIRKNYREELVKRGLVLATKDGAIVHDFLEHQRSAEAAAELRKHRSEAGRKGGKTRAKRQANARALPKQELSGLPIYREVLQVPTGTCTTSQQPKATPDGVPPATPLRSVAARPAETPAAELILVPTGELLSQSVNEASPDLTLGQRSKRITDEFAAVEPMCRWPAVNGIVKKAIQTGKYSDGEIRDAIVRLGNEGRTVTVESLRVELTGIPPSSRGYSDPDAQYERAMARALAREASQ